MNNHNKGAGDVACLSNATVHFMINFKRLCILSIACPVLTILVCLVTSIIFQAEDVHETHCQVCTILQYTEVYLVLTFVLQVYNIIPSISAITGISPQQYLWRIAIAIHIGPRFIMGALSKAYHENRINPVAEPKVCSTAIMP